MSRPDSLLPSNAVRTLLIALAIFVCSVPAAAAATACAVSSAPWLSLTITAGTAVTVADREISVRVHDNGCVEIHRPSFYRMAGDYRLALKPTELAALRAQVDPAKLAAFDAAKLRIELNQQQRTAAKSGSGGAENFAVLDGDHFHLGLQESGKRTTAAWSGLHEYAEFYPEVRELQSFSMMVKAAQALLGREDAVALQGATP